MKTLKSDERPGSDVEPHQKVAQIRTEVTGGVDDVKNEPLFMILIIFHV